MRLASRAIRPREINLDPPVAPPIAFLWSGGFFVECLSATACAIGLQRYHADMIEQIDHVNLVVRDLSAMVAFYRDALGMTVTKEVTISGRWVEQTVGLDDVLADVVYLELPAGPRIELIRYQSPPAHDPNGLNIPNTPGLRHMAFRVTDLDGVINQLRHADVQFVSDVQTVPDAQVTYVGGVRKRLVYFHDPEGNILELCAYETRSDETSRSAT